MDIYTKEYGSNLLYVFDAKKVKNNNELILVKDNTIITNEKDNVYHYSDDFESLLTFPLASKNRKTKQMISYSESMAVIKKMAYGVLSFSYQNILYSIGINHIYMNGKLYFHTGYNGFKLHAIHQRVSYLIIEDLGINEAIATHNHTSIMVQGILQQVTDIETKKEILTFLMKELAPTSTKEITEVTAKNTNILCIDIEYLHGKTHIR